MVETFGIVSTFVALVHSRSTADKYGRKHNMQFGENKVAEHVNLILNSKNANALHCYLLSLPPRVGIGLLPSLDVVAVFKAPSPESNPNSPLPLYALEGGGNTMEDNNTILQHTLEDAQFIESLTVPRKNKN
ncbi:hypothetical protein EV154DRAFT_558540 [Mucor mucedo]|nr:hypothetical protein EV154DRAFT_558540 [Mucor mucedo]